MIKIQSFTNAGFGENTYILSDDSKKCIIIDPGCYQPEEEIRLSDYINEHKLKVEKVVNTHCHIDHVLGNFYCKKTFDVPVYIPVNEKEVHKAVQVYAPNYGFPKYQHQEPDFFLKNEGKLLFGNSELDILYVPGHSPGHLVFYSASQHFCINGDVLFRESIGRTDLPGGNHEQLIESIHEVMFALPEETIVYCGHGPETSIGHEKRYNPWCKVM
ncbi:MBL fold metallo-hydrolase [Flexithrix dorotheae]|uniref:MBL fold metallo-hydrolase n=1 Tax=Flexithrix dorotheae TaxID=70993 RepID=UPI00036CB4FD|nr:MBL fold metallo-hydrolase [Flexithrix dorotheae]